MGSRLLLRRRLLALVGLALCVLGALPSLLEHHPLDRDTYPGAAGSAVSVAATHAAASQHCEASTTETRERCVACLLQRRVAGSQLPEVPQVDAAPTSRRFASHVETSPRSALLPPAGGRAPPAA